MLGIPRVKMNLLLWDGEERGKEDAANGSGP